MAKNRDWLKKVGEWLINQSTEENVDRASHEKLERLEGEIEKASQEKPEKVKKEVLKAKDIKETIQNETSKKKSFLNELTVERAFRIFLLSWEDEGFSSRYFLNANEANEMLETLDVQFRDELKTWLFKSSKLYPQIMKFESSNKNFSVKITSNLARSLNSEEEANFSISFKPYLAIGIPSWWAFFNTFINSLVLILLFCQKG